MDDDGDPPVAERGRHHALVFALGRVAAGDHEALEVVYRRTAAKLFPVCLRILSERTDAEEALQDVYVAVWRNAASFDPTRASPITWLAAIARNRAIDRLRTKKAEHMGGLEEARDVVDDTADAPAKMIAAQEAVRLATCLDELRAEEADLIRTAFYEGATYPDLADRKALPLGTVKTRIRRALLKLRACLA